ncbi:hypothetical protein Pmani_015724 [Petrolisthes manimaculis]|uniref:Uncharacterized protein n=1 Tax=Petrolisthes manimaculis TaxID=1843537 RepID=A0AAE1PQG3_9EUCA|nr:hypothetical protein Pmani_015724 [Petrolisthes manimaculis]
MTGGHARYLSVGRMDEFWISVLICLEKQTVVVVHTGVMLKKVMTTPSLHQIHNLPLPLEMWHHCDWAPTSYVRLLAVFTSLICFCRSSGFQRIDTGSVIHGGSCN